MPQSAAGSVESVQGEKIRTTTTTERKPTGVFRKRVVASVAPARNRSDSASPTHTLLPRLPLVPQQQKSPCKCQWLLTIYYRLGYATAYVWGPHLSISHRNLKVRRGIPNFVGFHQRFALGLHTNQQPERLVYSYFVHTL